MRRLLLLLLLSTTAYASEMPPEPQPVAVEKKEPPKVAAEPPKPVPFMKPTRRPVISVSEDAALSVADADETTPLPAYPEGARTSVGKMRTYNVSEEDTLLDVARHFRLGFVEVRAANPKIDPWTPMPGEAVVIPSFKLLPRSAQHGVVVNLAQMRMYIFEGKDKEPITFPIGVGREGLATPTGETSVVRKAAGPTWFPTARMLEEKPWLPKSVPAGPSNPLGTHALYLGWPTFLIHGSNKPWAIGRRVSSGCMRMYPEDISEVFKLVPVGTPVTIVDQPLLVGWVDGTLYFEANPSKTQGNDIEIDGDHKVTKLTDAIRKVILEAAGVPSEKIDWEAVAEAYETRPGYPVPISAKIEATTTTTTPATRNTPPAAPAAEPVKADEIEWKD